MSSGTIAGLDWRRTRGSRLNFDPQCNSDAMRFTPNASTPATENLMDERQRKAALARPFGDVGPGRCELLAGREGARGHITVNIGDYVRHVSCISL